MSNVTVKVRVSNQTMKRLAEQTSPDGMHRSPAMTAMLNQWADRYSEAMRARYNRFSRGGGDWAPLKPSTIAARRSGPGGKKQKQTEAIFAASGRGVKKSSLGKKVAILKDTGLLFIALQIGAHGNKLTKIRAGIRFGFDTTPHAGTSITIDQLAAVHHTGVPSRGIPARRILVEPPAETVRGMEADAAAALIKIAKEGPP